MNTPEPKLILITAGHKRMGEELLIYVNAQTVLTLSERKRQDFCDHLGGKTGVILGCIILPSNNECRRRWAAGEIIEL